MLAPALGTAPAAMPPPLTAFASRLLSTNLDITALWSIGHAAHEPWPLEQGDSLLAFADAATLGRLRRADDLHNDDVRLFVVIDGDRFENAWGNERLSGSLSRWAWRQSSDIEAYYEEARWAEGGRVIRVRRRALRLWAAAALSAT